MGVNAMILINFSSYFKVKVRNLILSAGIKDVRVRKLKCDVGDMDFFTKELSERHTNFIAKFFNGSREFILYSFLVQKICLNMLFLVVGHIHNFRN